MQCKSTRDTTKKLIHHVEQMDESVHIKIALGIKGSLMVCNFPPISPHYTEIPQWTLRIFSQIM